MTCMKLLKMKKEFFNSLIFYELVSVYNIDNMEVAQVKNGFLKVRIFSLSMNSSSLIVT